MSKHSSVCKPFHPLSSDREQITEQCKDKVFQESSREWKRKSTSVHSRAKYTVWERIFAQHLTCVRPCVFGNPSSAISECHFSLYHSLALSLARRTVTIWGSSVPFLSCSSSVGTAPFAGSLVEFSTKCVYVSFANCVCVRVSVCRHENYIPLALAAGQEEFAMQRKTHIPNGEKHCVPSGVSRKTGKSFSGTVYP